MKWYNTAVSFIVNTIGSAVCVIDCKIYLLKPHNFECVQACQIIYVQMDEIYVLTYIIKNDDITYIRHIFVTYLPKYDIFCEINGEIGVLYLASFLLVYIHWSNIFQMCHCNVALVKNYYLESKNWNWLTLFFPYWKIIYKRLKKESKLKQQGIRILWVRWFHVFNGNYVVKMIDARGCNVSQQ